jgi:hypothetical protein
VRDVNGVGTFAGDIPLATTSSAPIHVDSSLVPADPGRFEHNLFGGAAAAPEPNAVRVRWHLCEAPDCFFRTTSLRELREHWEKAHADLPIPAGLAKVDVDASSPPPPPPPPPPAKKEVVWYYCQVGDCPYRSMKKNTLYSHRRNVHKVHSARLWQ